MMVINLIIIMNKQISLGKIIEFREWIKASLPLENSLVAFDIILFFSDCLVHSRTVTVKDLFESLPYSYTAVRYHYKRLLSNGWLEQKNDTNDLRVKYVYPSQRMEELIHKLLDRFETGL